MDTVIRQRILEALDAHRVMTIATVRPDGWPQATTVGYVHDGLSLFFLCGADSQKAHNQARDDRVSLTIDDDVDDVMQIHGLSMAARAQRVTDPVASRRVLRRLAAQYPQAPALPEPLPGPEQVAVFRVEPAVISLLDY